MQAKINLEIEDSVFPPGLSTKKVYVRTSGDRSLYKVWLKLSGRDLPYIKQVTYLLHSTFPQPKRVVRRTAANPDCTLMLWTWGIFKVGAIIENKNGDKFRLEHNLSYGRQLTENSQIQFIHLK